eukprot:XP_765939.1 hypothetical protein [Theileria parva strain Muguga]
MFRQMLNDYYQKYYIYYKFYTLHYTSYMDKEDVKIFDDSLQNHITNNFNEDYVNDYSKLDDHQESGNELETARVIIRLIKREFEKFENVKNECIVPNLGRFSQIRSLARDLPVPSGTDTPCRTQASCDKLAMLMNLCSYIRTGVGFAYDIYATMIHVLGNMLSVLCGCIFVGPAHVCLLKNFPVKITTNLCRIYGGNYHLITLLQISDLAQSSPNLF